METPQEILPSSYSSQEVEAKWYAFWESRGFFTPKINKKVKPFTIVIPPPNITGILHMGHALNNTIQDILIRWQRMKGVPALWVPGTDHAGIATQNVVEKKLAKEGKTRFDLGRKKFVEGVWEWKKEYGSTIVKQLRKLGSSCDWTRERFTMDEGLSRAVRHTFVKLYEDGLIYQGHRIINWCPRCQTALSDEEAPYQEVDGKLYYYHYLVKNPKTGKLEKDEKVVIATTRPETMLGDTALAVNPKDKRYKGFEKKEIYLPLQNRKLAVIKDELIDPEFGTGIVKVTPAHDPNDFIMGQKHKLEFRNIFYPDARVNENGVPYQDLDRGEARQRVLEDLKKEGLFVKEEAHRHKVPHCYRCNTVVEPYLSKQWFVKMKPLAEKALRAQKEKKIEFFPKRWTKVYLHWLNNIQDWCISRQIWWGHQIPAWYCLECYPDIQTKLDRKGGPLEPNKPMPKAHLEINTVSQSEAVPLVALEKPLKCPNEHTQQIVQDPDVLDTWFSSWLWPFSTLGWPDKTEDLAYFYPTTALATAQEIIFFWVARMIMAGLHFMKEVPFRHVYIHGTVRTDSGQKMSKSLGNAIDPLAVIQEIGADALRFSIIMLTASGQDAYLSKEKFDVGRNFTNKIWNASRFSLMNLKDQATRQDRPGKAADGGLSKPVFKEDKDGLVPDLKSLSVIDQWILSSLERLIRDMEKSLTAYRFNDAASALYHFFWHEFCDWYLELCKPVFNGNDAEAKTKTSGVLLHVLETFLRLLHPFMPYISEEIWQLLKNRFDKPGAMPESIMLAAWPEADRKKSSAAVDRKVGMMQEVVVGIRDLRAKLNVPPVKTLQVAVKVKNQAAKKDLEYFASLIRHLAKLEKLEIVTDFERRPAYLSNILKNTEVFVKTEGVVDIAAEKDRIHKKIEETSKHLEQLEGRLKNKDFVQRAPEEVVEKEKARREELQSVLARLRETRELFSSLR